MRSLQLTPLTPDFLPEILQLDQQCFGGLWSQSAYEREIDSPNSILVGLVNIGQELGQEGCGSTNTAIPGPLEPDAKFPQMLAMGCLWAICEEAHITILAVHAHYRRQGLGQAVLEGMLQWAQQRGQEWATLEVRVSNAAAIGMYTKLGFQSVGRRRRYYPETGEDALILWRKGLQTPEFIQTLSRSHQQTVVRLAQHHWRLNSMNLTG